MKQFTLFFIYFCLFISLVVSTSDNTLDNTSDSLEMSSSTTTAFIPKTYQAVVIGATGAVGSNIVRELLQSPRCTNITTIVRRDTDMFKDNPNASKIHQIIQKDLGNLEPVVEESIRGHEIAFCALGVGEPTKVSREEFHRVDVEFTSHFAQVCKKAGVKHISLLGSVGADINSMFYFLRFKAEAEKGMTDPGFDRVSLFRPALLATDYNRYGIKDFFSQNFLRRIDWIFPANYGHVKVTDLAKAMRINAENHLDAGQTNLVEILHRPDFTRILASEQPTA